jgi:hypothetical protein
MLKKKFLFSTLLLLPVSRVLAQCAMCRAQLESMEDNSLAESVNDGIVYLMAVPYVLIALIGFFIFIVVFRKKSNIIFIQYFGVLVFNTGTFSFFIIYYIKLFFNIIFTF